MLVSISVNNNSVPKLSPGGRTTSVKENATCYLIKKNMEGWTDRLLLRFTSKKVTLHTDIQN